MTIAEINALLYVHSADAVLLAAADAVANRTLELMGMAPPAQVIAFRQVAST
jgi:hypothetical protein